MINPPVFTNFFKNVVNKHHAFRMVVRVFTLLLVIMVTACNTNSQLTIPTPTSSAVLEDTDPAPHATANPTSLDVTPGPFNTPPTAILPGSDMQRIKFAPGATSTVISGDLAANSTARYVLRAEAGQLMEVDLSIPEGVSLSVTTADGQAFSPITGGSTGFRGYLPRNGDYVLTVVSSNQPISYFLDISIPQRVAFERGTTSITVGGHVNAQQSLDYVLRAQSGQSMEIDITPKNSVQLIIYGVDGTVLSSGMAEGSSFRGELPISQDYVVTVRAADEEVSFTMNMIIPRQ